MNVKKFIAGDARLALKKVKEALGDDAVILSNRSVDAGVEILAVASRDMAVIMPSHGKERNETPDDYTVTLSSGGGQSPRRATAPLLPPTRTPPPRTLPPSPRPADINEFSRPQAPAAKRPLAPPSAPPVVQPRGELPDPSNNAAMMEELRALRKIVEQHLAGYAWGELARQEPGKAELLKLLLDAGFSPKLSNEWLSLVTGPMTPVQALEIAKAAASRALLTTGAQNELVERGGVYALVGPTGVGKTTTTAKLAARCVLRHGRDRVALITTDGYRIGAHEQLRIYGRILGVPVYVVKDAPELQQTLRELSVKHLVLIDTMGMSQRDRHVDEQIGLFENCKVARLLLLPATSRGDTMDDVLAAYTGRGLAGAVLTKLDEAVSLAPALDVLIRHQLPLAYVSNGQRVPEDLHIPNLPYLIHRAFKESTEGSAHSSGRVEPAMAMAGAGYFPTEARHV